MKHLNFKRVQNSFLLAACLLTASNGSFAETSPRINLKQIIRQFALNQKLCGQEKIYLQTDKEFYLAGENIWYKAYLVDATKHLPTDKSKFLYTELVNQNDSVVQRQKLHLDSLGFRGNLALPLDMESGKYQLRSYTIWMENAPQDYFFRKQLTIHNPYPNHADSIAAANQSKTITAGTTSGKNTATEASKPDLQFFPEGGSLINGRTNTVAFKAIDKSGLSVEVAGNILDNSGTKLTEFSSKHKGMGRFSLTVEAGQTYVAEIKTANGKTYQYPLPSATDKALAIRARVSANRLIYYLDKGEAIAPDMKCLLVIHQRGKLLRIEEVSQLPKIDTLKFDGLADGIAHIVLTDTVGNPLTERLFFVQNPANKKTVELVTTRTPQKDYKLQFSITDALAKAVEGNYSLSVTNGALPLGNLTHIESKMLLTSDLKGYIEDPDSYFSDSTQNRIAKLDNLLLTQGWTRFNVPELLKAKTISSGKFSIEQGQILSGIVRSKKDNKPIPEIPVTIMGMKSKVLEAPVTTADGRFYVEGITFTDSTHFIFRAGEKSKVKFYIEVDQDTFPKIEPGFLKQRIREVADKNEQPIKTPMVNDKIREMMLKQVSVNATRVGKPKSKSEFNALSDYTITQSQLKNYPMYTLPSVLPLIYPFIITDAVTDVPTIRDVQTNEFVTPALMVDDRYVEWDEFASYAYKTEDFESIDIVRGLVAQQLSKSAAIVIVKLNKNARNKIQSNVQMVNMLGWHKPVDFYTPKYNFAEEKKQLMPYSTLYWSADVKIGTTGKVEIPVTTKSNQVLRVVLEGISPKGEIIHYQAEVK